MFVGDEVVLDVSFAVARARLADLTGNNLLRSASEDAYRAGIADLGSDPPEVARVLIRELANTDGRAGLAIRWEASGPECGPFPALDADITIVPATDKATLLVLAGVYRAPPGPSGAAPDHATLHRVAAATIRSFLGRLAAGVAGSAPGRGRQVASPAEARPGEGPQSGGLKA